MKASGKSARRALLSATSPAARSKATGSAWTHATFTVSSIRTSLGSPSAHRRDTRIDCSHCPPAHVEDLQAGGSGPVEAIRGPCVVARHGDLPATEPDGLPPYVPGRIRRAHVALGRTCKLRLGVESMREAMPCDAQRADVDAGAAFPLANHVGVSTVSVNGEGGPAVVRPRPRASRSDRQANLVHVAVR